MIVWLVIAKPRQADGTVLEQRWSVGLADPWRVGSEERILRLPSLSLETMPAGFGQGGSSAQAGSLTLANGDLALTGLHDLVWSEAAVDLYRAEDELEGMTLADFTLVRRMRSERIAEGADRVITIAMADLSRALDEPLALPRYAGTGGAEGPAELAERVKPFAIGPQTAVEPVMVKRAALILQFHARRVNSVQLVTDRGVALTNGGDIETLVGAGAGFDELDAFDLSGPEWAGTYITWLAGGMGRLAREPKGLVVIDFEGDAEGGYVERPGAVIARVFEALAPAAAGITVDTAAMDALDAAFPHAVKLFTSREGPTVADWIETVAAGVGALWWVDALANLKAALFDFNGMETAVEDWQVTRPALVDAWPRWRRLVLGFRVITRLHSSDELAAIGALAGLDVADFKTQVSGAEKPEDNADVTANSAASIIFEQSTAPTDPQPGWLWVDTSVSPNVVRRWNGSSWIRAADDIQGELGADVTKSHAGDIIFRQSGAPANAEVGWLWRDTDTDNLFRWNGSAWELISTEGAPPGTNVGSTPAEDVEGQALSPSQNLLGKNAGPLRSTTTTGNAFHSYLAFADSPPNSPLEDFGLEPAETISLSGDIRLASGGNSVQWLIRTWAADGATLLQSVGSGFISSSSFTRQKVENFTIDLDARFINFLLDKDNTGTEGTGESKNVMLNRGPKALPFEEPPFRPRRETADDVPESATRVWIDPDQRTGASRAFGALASPVIIADGVQIFEPGGSSSRRLTNAVAVLEVTDGQSVVFDPVRGEIPEITFFGSGIGLPDPNGSVASERWWREIGALNVTAAGFDIRAEFRAIQGQPTNIVDASATGDSTAMVIEKSVAAEAVDDTYKYQYDVVVAAAENTGSEFEPIIEPASVTLGFDSRQGGIWTERAERTFFNFDHQAVLRSTNQTININVDGMGAASAFRVRLKSESGNGGGIDVAEGGFDSVTYNIEDQAIILTETATPGFGEAPITVRVDGGREESLE